MERTTRVMENTIPATLSMETAIVDKTLRADSGPPIKIKKIREIIP
ncbi:MAG: hypothetical protein U1C19_07770 [Methanobacteriaceae archaeon]|nr:hypothetical protein [Methanobacteriaceae archaeon]